MGIDLSIKIPTMIYSLQYQAQSVVPNSIYARSAFIHIITPNTYKPSLLKRSHRALITVESFV